MPDAEAWQAFLSVSKPPPHLVRGIPDATWREIRIAAINRGMTIGQYVRLTHATQKWYDASIGPDEIEANLSDPIIP